MEIYLDNVAKELRKITLDYRLNKLKEKRSNANTTQATQKT